MKIIPMSAANPVALPTTNNAVESANEPSSKIITDLPAPNQQKSNLALKALKIFFKPVIIIAKNIHNILIYGGLAGTVAYFTPGVWKSANDLAQTELIGLLPSPTNNSQLKSDRYLNNVDRFIQNFKDKDETDFKLVQTALDKAEIDYRSSPSSTAKKKFESREDVDNALFILSTKSKSALYSEDYELFVKVINFLNDYKVINQIIWGDRADPNVICQNSEPNCQLMAVLRGQMLIPERVQELRSSISVEGYSLDSKGFYIDTTVIVNGKKYFVPFSELSKYMSTERYTPSQSSDGSLFTPLLNHAMKKELSQYDVIPNIFPSASPIVITNKNYCTVGISAFSDRELDKHLSKAPGTLITVASRFTLDDIRNSWSLRKQGKREESYSYEKAVEFKTTMNQKVKDISLNKVIQKPTITEKPVDENKSATLPHIERLEVGVNGDKQIINVPMFKVSFNENPLSADKKSEKVLLGKSSVLTSHMYIVESYDPKTKSLIISDTHGYMIELNNEEIRESLFSIVLPSDDVNFLSERTIPIFGLALSTGLLYWLAKRKAKIVLKKIFIKKNGSTSEV